MSRKGLGYSMIWGYLLVLLSACGFGLMPIFALYAYEDGMEVPTLLFLRFLFSAVILFAIIFYKLSKWRITRKQLMILFVLGGVLYTMQSTFYFSALTFIPASLTALLLYLFPVFVAILSFLIQKERLSIQMMLSIIISLLGIILILGSPSGEIRMMGVILAICAAITYSLYILLGSRITSHLPPILTSGFVALFAMISFFIYGLSTASLSFDFAPSGWLYALLVALFSTVLSIVTFFAGMKIIGPTKASILSMIEPVVTTVFSTLLFADQLTPLQMLGGSIVLFGAALVFIAKEKKKTAANAEVSS